MKIEIIMSAYNNAADMKIVLDGYLRQSDKDFSICVADDGSDSTVEMLVNEYHKKGLNIRHVWHEDRGYRRGAILNLGIQSSIADFIVLTDSDCVPSCYFVEDYKNMSSPDVLVIGRRIDLYPNLSEKLRSGGVALDKLDSPIWLLGQFVTKGLRRPELAMRLPSWVINLMNRKQRKALGANMGVAREALLSVNGFDTDFEGYGMEESDLEWRLVARGLSPQNALGRCALFHLWHPQKPRRIEARLMLEKKMREGAVRCSNGILKI